MSLKIEIESVFKNIKLFDNNISSIIEEYSYLIVPKQKTNVFKIRDERHDDSYSYLCYTKIDDQIYKISGHDIFLNHKEMMSHLSHKYIYFEIDEGYELIYKTPTKELIYDFTLCQARSDDRYIHNVNYTAYKIVKRFDTEEEFIDDVCRFFYIKAIEFFLKEDDEDDEEVPSRLEISNCLGFMNNSMGRDCLNFNKFEGYFPTLLKIIEQENLEHYTEDLYEKKKYTIKFFLKRYINLFLSF